MSKGLTYPRQCFPPIWWLYIALFNVFFILCYNLFWDSILPNAAKVYSPGKELKFVPEQEQVALYEDEANSTLRITILESAGVHDEVVSALLHSFGGVGNSEISMFLKRQRYGIQDIITKFSLSSRKVTIYKWDDFGARVVDKVDPSPHIIVSTTCEWDLSGRVEGPHKVNTRALNELLEARETYLFCTFHHADNWVKGKHVDLAQKWAEAGMVDFVGLSEHTVDFFKNATEQNWDLPFEVNTRVLPPIFPVDHPIDDKPNELGLAMQGDYDPNRRDYKSIFSHLDEAVTAAKEAAASAHEGLKVVLHLIGHGGHPDVPKDLKENVEFNENLPYPDFYSLMSRQFAVIPAFATDEYYDRKASSSVAASLIAGAPLVASEDLLDAYTYLPREATWQAEDDESDMDVVIRAVTDKQGFLERRQKTREAADRIMIQNRHNTEAWMDAGRAKFKSAEEWTEWSKPDSEKDS